jgi:hypothetical protein
VKIALEIFAGEIPKVEPRLLPPNNAAASASVRYDRGNLEPLREATFVVAVAAGSRSFFKDGASWLVWPHSANAVRGATDLDRLYVTEAVTGPTLIYDGVSYPLAVPTPTTAPVLSLASGTVDETLKETILYTFTWVTSIGEESQPAPISAEIDYSPGVNIALSMPEAVPPGRLITKKRIYRSVTGTSGVTDLYFVDEITGTITSYTHNMANKPPVEALPSDDYDAPIDGLIGLIAMPNGMMAAHNKKTVYFCEPYKPHAWPMKYSLTVNDTIVGLAAFGTSLAILTVGTPYVAQGLHPEGMAMERMEVSLPCLSRNSIVDLGYAAMYASTDGLVQVNNAGAQLVSKDMWSKDQWYAMDPETIQAGQMTGRYLFTHVPRGGSGRQCIVVTVDGTGQFISPVTELGMIDFFYDTASGTLYALNGSGDQIISFDDPSGALKSYSWTSKPFRLPANTSIGCAIVDATAPLTGTPAFSAKVYSNGVLVATITTPNKIVRLPSGLSELIQVEITGNYTVTRIVLAGNPDEAAT